MASPKTQFVRILSLDGGGDKCLSAVQILYELFRKLQESGSTQGQPKPCDYFDLICGSEWGAIIALMLGRKKMVGYLLAQLPRPY